MRRGLNYPFIAICLVSSGCSTVEPPSLEKMSVKPEPTAFEVALNKSLGGAAWNPRGSVPTTITADSGRRYFTPTPASTVRIIDAVTGKPTDVYWATLTQEDVRRLYDGSDEQVELEQLDIDGSAQALPVTAEIKKATYRVKFYSYRYRTQPCAENSPGAGGIAVGTGMRITAEVTVTKASANITGLMGLSAAVQAGHAKGRIRIQTFGIASGTSSINSYLAVSATQLTPETIQKAVEALGVIKAVADTPSVTLSPNYLFVESPDNTKCLADLLPKPGG